MKLSNPPSRRFLFAPFLALLITMLSSFVAQANPFASMITNSTADNSGTISFFLNESTTNTWAGYTQAVNITVVYDDGTTNAGFNGITTGINQQSGIKSFALAGHNGYQIICHRDGNGVPYTNSVDVGQTNNAPFFTGWNSPRGVDANRHAKNGGLFGRVYIGNSATNIGDGTPLNPRRGWGIFALSPDFSTMVTSGALTYTNGLTPWNPSGGGPGKYIGAFSPDANGANAGGPYRIRIADDDSLFVTDFGTPGGGLLQFGPNFEYTNIVIGPVGEAQGINAGTHGDPQEVFTTGSIAGGDLKIWTVDPGLPVGQTNIAPNFSSNSVGGFLGISGRTPTEVLDYNNIFRYDVGAGDASHYIVRDVNLKTAGTGYNAFNTNDVLIVSGGTPGGSAITNCVIQVTGTNGAGGITSFVIVNPGDYDGTVALPATPNTPANTLGTGTGATFDLYLARVLWHQAPQFAACLGLQNFFDNQNMDLTLSPDHTKIFAGFRRLNFSDGNLQVFDMAQPGIPRVWTSLREIPPAGSGAPFDAFMGSVQGGGGNYAGSQFSPDGRFLCNVMINNELEICTMTNGLPDESTLVRILDLPATANARGMCWDAAGNILVCSSGFAQLRSFSLGNTTTCITSNDFTTQNGTFQLILPPVTASIAATANASQNYTNNNLLVPPLATGNPIPGNIRITLSTNNLTTATAVAFTLSGTAVNPTHYTIATNGDVAGLVLAGSTLTFPASAMPGGGNWTANLLVTPTALPVFTNTMTVIATLNAASSYLRQAPLTATVFITNTGPQVLLLSAAQAGTTMYRGTTNDYAEFIIVRLGDPNGPTNTPTSIVQSTYTVTNFTYFGGAGAADYPGDYTARAQKWAQYGGVGIGTLPVDGQPGIVVNAGDASFTNIVGNPVFHGSLTTPPTNVTITISLARTNGVNFNTNMVSLEGAPYWVVSNAVAMTELDNRVGSEVVLWSNPLTNAADSANWTLTFAATNMVSFTPPTTNTLIVVPQYTNNYVYDGLHDFYCSFGFDPSTDYIPIARSPAMVENGWANVLKMTVNKNDTFSPAGVNVYPGAPGAFTNFGGNFALRFNMYLQLKPSAIANPFSLSSAREFALFGINHQGTNCNWRIVSSINVPGVFGNDRTNQDGIWCAIDASTLSLTPADFDMFVPPPTPNAGFNVADRFSQGAQGQRGVFKSVPFDNCNTPASAPGNIGGQPVDKWVDVSLEVTKGTNINLFMNKSSIFGNQPLTNGPVGVGVAYTNGTVMLGYGDPVQDGGGNSPIKQFVYYSNVRVVELSPYQTVQGSLSNPAGTNFLVAQFSSLTFTSSASFASNPLTNTYYRGTGTFTQPNTGVPTAGLQTNKVNATSMNDSYVQTFNSAVDGTNYMNVFSDAAGSVTSRVVAVEVVLGPTNRTFGLTSTNSMGIAAAGPSVPTSFQWYFNVASNFAGATKLVNGAHYGPVGVAGRGVTGTNMWITNMVTGDAGFYWCAVTNTAVLNGAAGFVVPQAAVLTVISPPTSVAAIVTPQNNLWGSNTTFTASVTGGDAPFTYQWKKNGANLVNSSHVGGATASSVIITNITAGDSGSYTVGVSNIGGGVLSSPGILTEFTPFPTISLVFTNGAGQVVMNFTSTNSFDTSTSFTLESAGVVTGPYTNNPSGVFSGSNPSFSVTGGMNGDVLFYRIRHKD